MNRVFILDVDGVLTPGNFFYSKEGKVLKVFGADDWDLLKEIKKIMPVEFITADKKGFPIVEKRIEEEMGWALHLVPHYPNERWEWISNRYRPKQIFFMGDGCYDYLSLKNTYGITTCDALDYVKRCAKYVTTRAGGNRAVAEACLHLLDKFEFDWKLQYDK